VENRKYGQGWQKTEGARLPARQQGHFSQTAQENKNAGKVPSEGPEKKAVQNFRDLKIWRLGKELVVEVYKLTRPFPNEELYGLTTQMRRAAISIPSNISEGHSRRATKDYQRFLNIAAGSCAELETQVEISLELGYLKEALCGGIMEKIDYERRMLRKLIGKLSESAIHHPPSDIQSEERVPSPVRPSSNVQKREPVASPLQY
jgi:four helix bundle protein